MVKTAELLDSKLKIIIRKKKLHYIERGYDIRTDKQSSKLLIFEYLCKFPIFGYKFFLYKNLQKIHELVINKKYKDDKNINLLNKYKEDIKQDFKKKKWNQLETFYIK